MSTNGFEDKGSYPYDAPPGKVIPLKKIPGGFVTQRYSEVERRDFIVGLTVAATMLVIGFGFGWACGVLYGW